MQAQLLELIGDPVLTLRADFSLLRANPAARDWLGGDAASGWQQLRRLAAPRLDDWLQATVKALDAGRPAPSAPPLRLADHRLARLHLLRDRPLWHLHIRLEGDAQAAEQAVVRDQAERAQAELAAWFELSTEPLLLLDAQGLILRSNAAFQALCTGQPGSLHETPETLRQLLGWSEAGFAQQDSHEGPLVDPQGRTRWLHARLRRISAGHRPEWLAVFEDRSAEHERDVAHQQLDALMDTAEAGLATFHPDAGWLRPQRKSGRPGRGLQGSLQGISRDMVDPGSVAEFERLQKALKKGEAVEARYQVQHPELGRRWLLTRVTPGQLAGGRPSTSVVTLDVTAQAQAESALQLRSESERAVLDSVLVGIVSVGPQGIEWMNRSARRMFSCELADVQGRPMGVLAPDEPDHPFHRPDLGDEGQAEMFECQLRGRDGREFWVIGNAVQTPRDDGRPQRTYALLDIDRRRQAEAASARAQASLARIIEAAPVAISLHDADTLAIEQLNQAALDLAGRSEAELLGGSPLDLFGAEAGGLIHADMRAALDTHAVTQREYRLGEGEQRRVWDTRFLHLAGSDGTPEQILLVASDVTEHRAAEEARLQAAITQRELLVREVHHRIKNNLQGVAGLLQQIAARRPEVADVLKEAVGQVQAIAQVYGLQVGASGPLMLARVWQAILGSVQRMRGREIVASIEGDAERWTLPEAESIPIALSLNELLGNALRHSPAGEVRCRLIGAAGHVVVEIVNPARLPEGFRLQSVPSGVSGLGLVRALLPRRSAILSLEQAGGCVVCRLELHPPSVGHGLMSPVGHNPPSNANS
jgi:PAS domain S-box-containing protein